MVRKKDYNKNAERSTICSPIFYLTVTHMGLVLTNPRLMFLPKFLHIRYQEHRMLSYHYQEGYPVEMPLTCLIHDA